MSVYSLAITLLYLSSTLAVILTRFANYKLGNLIGILVAFISFVLAAFRPWYFPDVDTYEIMYEFASSGEFNDPAYWIAHGEPGFKIFSYFLSSLGFGYSGFLLSMAILSYLLLMYVSRLSKIPFVYMWFTYFSFFYITRDLGVIRLSIASHLIVIFFMQRKIIWQSLSLLTATLSFQYFALIAVIAKPFSRIKIEWFSISLLFIFSIILSYFINFDSISFLLPQERVNDWQGALVMQPGGSAIIAPLIRNSFFAVLLYLFFKNKTNIRIYRLWLWAAIFSVALYIMASGILVVAQRFSAYFGAVVPLALAFLLQKKIIKDENFFLIVSVCILNFISLFYFNSWLWK